MRNSIKTKALLLENGHKLSDIAQALSFSSAQHLSNYFTKLTGMTPNGFRQQDRKLQTEETAKGWPSIEAVHCGSLAGCLCPKKSGA